MKFSGAVDARHRLQLPASIALLLAFSLLQSTAAQDTSPADSPAPEAASFPSTQDQADDVASSRVLPTNTEIHLRMLEQVASNTHKRGDRFKVETAAPVYVNDALVIPVGSPGEGEVIHAAKPGMAGRAGELILVVRYVQAGESRVKLKSFTAGTGDHRMNLANGLGISLGIPGLFVVGKNIVVPAGTDVFAKVAVDVSLPMQSGSRSEAPVPSDASTTTNGEERS